MPSSRRAAMLSLAVAAVGCGGRTEQDRLPTDDATSDAAVESGVVDSWSIDAVEPDEGVVVDYDPCPIHITGRCDASELRPKLFEASVILGSGARIVDVDRDAILAERMLPSGPSPVLSHGYGETDEAILGALPVGSASMRAIAVTSFTYPSAGPISYRHVALLCGAERCALYGARDHGPSELELLVGSELPAGAAFDDVADSSTGALYVVGDGIFRFAGGVWTTEVAAGGPRFHAVAVEGFDGDEYAFAVGDGGRAMSRMAGVWETLAIDTTERLVAVDAEWRKTAAAAIVSESGALFYGSRASMARCLADGFALRHVLLFASEGSREDRRMVGVGLSGEVLRVHGDRRACIESTAMPGARKLAPWSGGVLETEWIMTDEVVFGTDHRAID